NKIDRIMRKQMEHFLRPGGKAYLIFRFKLEDEHASERLSQALSQVFWARDTDGSFGVMHTNGSEIYYMDFKIKTGGEEVMYYLRYYKRARTIEIGALGYPESQDGEIIKMMRGDIELINNIFRMDFGDINRLFGMLRD
ncbi:MAG: hypothetical protein QXF85_00550, partial [Candidatus Micrarchaeaceae archaeon]